MHICAPKLEEGEMASTWRPNDNDLENKLLDTGIDVEAGEVTITADTFKVRNNAGKQTALVDAKGQITAELLNAMQIVTEALKA